VVDFADAAYFYVRFFLALVTAISAVFTLRYGLAMHAHTGRRTMAFAGAALLAVDVVLSSYDAVYNGFLTPGTPIALINWLWLFGFDLLLPIWAFLLLHTQRQRDAGEAELARLAVTDLLTGVLNRRGFLDQAHAVIARARRRNEPVAVAMLDIDRFKTINDGFGHDAGDRVLRDFASEAARGLRAGDILGRFGGEEFVVLLPGVAAADAVPTIERLRNDIRSAVPHPAGGSSAVTVSAGIASLPGRRPADVELMESLGKADAALYEAKEAGRDRVALAA